ADAFVFFGATGDLAFKKIFPALQGLTRRGLLDMPVIGLARPALSVDGFRQRAKESIQANGTLDAAAFAKLAERLQYIDGDYQDPRTFERLKAALGAAK